VVCLLGRLAGCASTGDMATEPVAGTGLTGQETEAARRARIRLELGASYYQQGNFPVAIDELRQALAIDPNFAAAHGMLALVYMDLGERAKAEESFRRALAIAPADSELNNNYGWFLCQTGREQASLAPFAAAVRNPLYATPAKPLRNAGLCLLRLGDESAAQVQFLSAFQVDARDAIAMYQLAELHLKRRELERARFYAQRLLTTHEAGPEALWLALRLERAAGNRDAVASLALQLRRRFPASAQAENLAAGRFGD
jgi:type IV pilus assembly protein PilF